MGHIYEGNIKYQIETNINTPNDSSTLVSPFSNKIISKHPIKFLDVHNVYLCIKEIDNKSNINLITKNNGTIHAIANIGLSNNYQLITYYQSNYLDILNKNFNSINCNSITIELRDDVGNYYNLETDYSATLEFTVLNDRYFEENIFKN